MALDFLGIGAQKAGTTWLFEHLSKHPEIAFPAPVKEVHFWDKQMAKGIDWYKGMFEREARVAGEITPAYAILPSSTIAQVKQSFPDLKFLFLHRDPVERAWSAANMFLRNMDMQVEEASDQWFMDFFSSQHNFARGDYASNLTNWMEHFPAERFLVIDYAKVSSEPAKLLEAVAEHLDVSHGYFTALPQESLHDKVFAGKKGAIRPALKTFLETQFAEPQKQFATKLAEWKKQGCQIV